jgi:hypothetical protein
MPLFMLARAIRSNRSHQRHEGELYNGRCSDHKLWVGEGALIFREAPGEELESPTAISWLT